MLVKKLLVKVLPAVALSAGAALVDVGLLDARLYQLVAAVLQLVPKL